MSEKSLSGSEIIKGIAERLGKRIGDAARFSEHMTCPSTSVIAHVTQLELAPLATLMDAARVYASEDMYLRDVLRDCEAAAKGEKT